jgi:hypothetical protein
VKSGGEETTETLISPWGARAEGRAGERSLGRGPGGSGDTWLCMRGVGSDSAARDREDSEVDGRRPISSGPIGGPSSWVPRLLLFVLSRLDFFCFFISLIITLRPCLLAKIFYKI